VILNLLPNASDAMVDAHDRPRQLLIRTDRKDDDRVPMSVRDAGMGIDAQTMNKLFDAFYTTKTDGMGVGLSISRSIIERHRGDLWAEPMDQEPRSGCRFLAPAKAWPSRRREGLEPIPRCNGRHRSQRRILCPGIGIRPSRQWDRAPVRMTPVDQRLAWLHAAGARYATHIQWIPLDACIGGSR
jgi:Histidine kinase-, DNA gyrase B-, and HSP90-like ATPase